MLNPTEINCQALVYLGVPLRVRTAQGAPADPTSDDVELAIVRSTTLPSSPTWIAGSWSSSETEDDLHFARVLIGPTAPVVGELALGLWWPFVRITDAPEIPVVRAAAPFRIVA